MQDEQDKMKDEMAELENYNKVKIAFKKEVLHNAKQLFDIRSRITKAFEDGIFPLSKENLHKEYAKEEEEQKKRKKQFLIG